MQIKYFISHGYVYVITQANTNAATVSLAAPAAAIDDYGLAPTIAEIKPENGRLVVRMSPELITDIGAADAVAAAVESVGYALNAAARKYLYEFGVGKQRPSTTLVGIYHPITDIYFAARNHPAK